jgi:hypothetical protein
MQHLKLIRSASDEGGVTTWDREQCLRHITEVFSAGGGTSWLRPASSTTRQLPVVLVDDMHMLLVEAVRSEQQQQQSARQQQGHVWSRPCSRPP